MTQDEIIEMVREAGGSDVGGHGWTTWVGTQSTEFLERFANLVAAKERLAQPEQEPVAWISPSGALYRTRYHAVANAEQSLTPLYTHPTRGTWVGLTDAEIKAFDTWHDNREEEVGWCNPSEIVAYIEAKLKEKNNG